MFSRKKRFLRTNVAPYPFYLVMLAIGLLIPGSDNQAHEVSGVSQASCAGAFYGGCRKHASAQYCQCIQDQFGTHLSKAEMIAAMLGAPPHSARMAAHAVPYCRSGQSIPWPPAGDRAGRAGRGNSSARERDRIHRDRVAEKKRNRNAVQFSNARVVAALAAQTVLNGVALGKTKEVRWPLTLTIKKLSQTSRAWTGELAWPTLDAVHKVHGTYHGSDLSFSDQGYIKKGSASLKCTYRLTLWNNLDYFRGQWRCPGQSGKMTIDLRSKKRG